MCISLIQLQVQYSKVITYVVSELCLRAHRKNKLSRAERSSRLIVLNTPFFSSCTLRTKTGFNSTLSLSPNSSLSLYIYRIYISLQLFNCYSPQSSLPIDHFSSTSTIECHILLIHHRHPHFSPFIYLPPHTCGPRRFQFDRRPIRCTRATRTFGPSKLTPVRLRSRPVSSQLFLPVVVFKSKNLNNTWDQYLNLPISVIFARKNYNQMMQRSE